jgi:hypothetical protein
MIGPPTLSDLMADPGELDITCLDCHHNTTMPVAALLPRYAAETPFPEAWGGFRCSACGGPGGSTFGPTGRPARRQGRSPRHRRWAGYTPNWKGYRQSRRNAKPHPWP